jgi:uncharacterized protein
MIPTLRSFAKSAAAALSVLLFAGHLGLAQAQEEIPADHLAAARAAVAASNTTTSLDGILPQTAEGIKSQLFSNRPDAVDQISLIVDEATLALAPRRGNLEDEVARIYARIFTIDELKIITDFYNTEAGKKLIRETPVIARSIEEAARVWTAGVRRDLQQEVGKKVQEAGLQ